VTRPRALLFVPVFAAGLAVGVALPVLGGSAGPKVTTLFTVALSSEFTPGREVLIDLVEIPPNQKLSGGRGQTWKTDELRLAGWVRAIFPV